MRSQILLSILGLVTALHQVSARPGARHQMTRQCGKAVYLMTNEEDNKVVALAIGDDGQLSAGTCIAARGAGGVSIDGATNKPAAPDALVSQSALTVAAYNLFAVNAGSNTVTMFSIDQDDNTKLTMVGQPVSVPGEFPNTVAASEIHGLVCVGTSGAVAGVSCASFSAEQGVGEMDTLRPFALDQTTPPVGPTNTVSQVFFSENQGTLFTTVKGDPAQNKTGFLASFPVASACGSGADVATVGQEGTRSFPEGTAVLFGSTAIPGSTDIFVTDASFGGAVLSIDPDSDVATVKGQAAVEGQAATCWAAISPATGTAFVTDVGMNRLVEISVKDVSIMGEIDLSANGDPGLIDLRGVGNFMYALSPGNGTTQAAVTVVDALTKKQVQHFELGWLGVGKNAMGMAAL